MTQIRVGGVNGVGKTTLIDKTLRELRRTGLDVPVIKGSEIMAAFLNVPVDALPEQKDAAREAARLAMYQRISELPSGVRDGHFSVAKSEGGFEYPSSAADKSCVGALVLVEADLNLIAERRVRSGRPHRPADLALIAAHQREERSAANRLAIVLDVPLYFIDNSDSVSSLAVEQLLQIINTHCAQE